MRVEGVGGAGGRCLQSDCGRRGGVQSDRGGGAVGGAGGAVPSWFQDGAARPRRRTWAPSQETLNTVWGLTRSIQRSLQAPATAPNPGKVANETGLIGSWALRFKSLGFKVLGG